MARKTKLIYQYKDGEPHVFRYCVLLPTQALNILYKKYVYTPKLFKLWLLQESERAFWFHVSDRTEVTYRPAGKGRETTWVVQKYSHVFDNVLVFDQEEDAVKAYRWYLEQRSIELRSWVEDITTKLAKPPVFKELYTSERP